MDERDLAILTLTCLPNLERFEQRNLVDAILGGSVAPGSIMTGLVNPAILSSGHRHLLRSGRPQKQARTILERVRLTGSQVAVRGRPGYPGRLVQLPDAPGVIYWRGTPGLPVPGRLTIGLVGTRKPSSDGLALTRQTAAAFSRAGAVVISGMALGTDAAAHEGALAASGETVAVVASGVDDPTPRSNAGLARRIALQGALMSENPPGTAVRAYSFPERNRLIAALSDALIVFEAGQASGTRITADRALELGKPVFALAGRPGDPLTEGSRRLLGETGVRPFLSVEDVYMRLGREPVSPGAWPLGRDLLQLAHLLADHLPGSLDSLLAGLRPREGVSTILGSLSLLQLHNIIHEDESGILSFTADLPPLEPSG